MSNDIRQLAVDALSGTGLGERTSPPIPPREELLAIYREQGLGAAKHYRVGEKRLYTWLDHYGISRNSRGGKLKKKAAPPREELLAVYRSYGEAGTSKYYHVGRKTVTRWLEECGIEKNPPHRHLKKTIEIEITKPQRLGGRCNLGCTGWKICKSQPAWVPVLCETGPDDGATWQTQERV